jgi:hypothetical protein
MHFMSHGRGVGGGDSPVCPLNSPTFGHGVGVRKLSHEVAGRPGLGGLPIQLTHT